MQWSCLPLELKPLTCGWFPLYLRIRIALQERHHFCLYNRIIPLNLQLQSPYQSLWQHFTAVQQERLKTKTTGLPTSQVWLQLCTSMFRLQDSVYHLYHNERSDKLFAVLHYLGKAQKRTHSASHIMCHLSSTEK